MATEDGGAAFPQVDYLRGRADQYGTTNYEPEGSSGMTLRDYFAAKALMGLLAGQTEVACEAISNSDKAAAWSYEFADALIAERAKPSGSQP